MHTVYRYERVVKPTDFDPIPMNWIDLDRVLWIVFRPESTGYDQGLDVFGRAEGVRSETGRRWNTSGGDLLQGREQPGYLFQLEDEAR
jgi:hypothetical protein